MSELTAYNSERIYWAVEQVEREAGGIDTLRLDDNLFYLKSEADKAFAEKDTEIAELKAMAKEPSVPNRTCRKCGNIGTLMCMPIVKDGRKHWDLYNNKGIDYVIGIQCAHCGEVAFVTKQIHEYELRRQKYKRCLDKAKWCESEEKRLEAIAPIFDTDKECWEYNSDYWYKWHKRWLELAERFKED